MIKDKEALKGFEKELQGKETADFERNLKIFEALYREARKLKKIPGDNPLAGIEGDIKMARVLNSV